MIPILPLLSASAFAANNCGALFNRVQKEVSANGITKFIRSHRYILEPNFWNPVEECISSGEDRWIRIGTSLLSHADAGMAQDLELALGRSIKKNPIAVLVALKPLEESTFAKEHKISFVRNSCAATVPDDSPNYDPSPDILELKARVDELSASKVPAALREIKGRCVQSLRDAIRILHTIKKAPTSTSPRALSQIRRHIEKVGPKAFVWAQDFLSKWWPKIHTGMMAGDKRWLEIANLCEAVAEHCKAVRERIRREILSDFCASHVDESPWPIQGQDSQSYMWALSNRRGAYYQFEPTRSGKVAEVLLKEHDGAILVDRYGGYSRVKKRGRLRVGQCWSQARREFFERLENYPYRGR